MTSVKEDLGYRRLKNHLIASTGLAFYADRDNRLAELIGDRLTDLSLPDCTSYAELLADSGRGEAEMDVLIGRLAIAETYFFRDPEQFSAIRDIVLPDILERKQSSRQLRIWSAGCASGAEPYSLAMLLMHELSDRLAGWQIEIEATDLNRNNLAQAAEGKFRAWAVRSLSDEVKRDCFSKEGQTWTIHPRYKQWISFHQMNLAAPLQARSGLDLILCRNVMIYFAPEVSSRLIGHFQESLDEGGWLVVGSSEHNSTSYRDFRTVNVTGARLYQKNSPLEAVPPPSPVAKAPTPDAEGLRALVDRRDWQGAAEYGGRLLAQNQLDAAVHFYHAQIFENLGAHAASERSLRQAIYLDRNFARAHYHLGLALQRVGQMLEAARSYRNAMRALDGMRADEIVKAGERITVTELKELVRVQWERVGRTGL